MIKGPFGLGLELKAHSVGKYILFAGGTGILPFLDLLDFLLKKSIHMALEKKGVFLILLFYDIF